MTTQRRLSQEGKILLTNVIPQLKKLGPGASVLITDTPLRLAKIRRHLYNYFSGTGEKFYYRTIAESSTTLRVICKDLTPASAASELSFVENYFIDQLSTCETYKEAQEKISKAHVLGELSDKQAMEAIEEYERQMGKLSSEKNVETEEEIKLQDLSDPFVLVNPELIR